MISSAMMRKSFHTASTILVIFAASLSAYGQSISPLAQPDELAEYFRERLVQIEVNAYSKEDNTVRIHRGTGILISPDGYVLTAKHVIEPAKNSAAFELRNFPGGGKPVQVRIADGLRMVDLKPNLASIHLSALSDVAIFKVSSPSTENFKNFMCVELDSGRVQSSGTVKLATWQYQAGSWAPILTDAEIGQSSGPGDNYEYWGLDRPFERSMSGGAILQKGKVVAVASNTLTLNTQALIFGSYANVLRFATDLGLEGRASKCTPYIPGEIPPHESKSVGEFYSSTCEGTLAAKAGQQSALLSFKTSGNYRLRPRDLACRSPCSCNGEKPEKTVSLILNHTLASPKQQDECAREDDVSFSTGEPAYYGVQILPVLVDTIDERTWLYRNAALYVRTPSGHFTRQEPQRKPKKIDLKPSDFSSATRQSLTDPGPISSCVRSLSRTECENVLSIQKFERLTFSRSLWHGFLQARKNPVSTLSPDGGPVWALPAQMLAVQDVQLKNWILKYIPAKEKNSTRPVNFELCINSDWKGFYVRTFSPLRNIDAKSIRVFLQD